MKERKTTEEMQLVDIDKLIPYINNARTHSKKQIEKLRSSLREFGFVNPVIIDRDYNVIAGHGRIMAAKEEGIEKVPCVFVDYLTEAQKKAYILADNRMALDAGWDEELLAVELEDLKCLDFNLDLTGFDGNELARYMAPKEEATEDDFDVDSELEKESKVKPGDVWKLGRHRLMCGDSTSITDVEKLMNGEIADLVFTDPPYGMKKEAAGVANDNLNYEDLLEFNRQWIPITFSVLKGNGSWYCWGQDEPLMDIWGNILRPMAKEQKITFRNLITWDKGHVYGQKDAGHRMYPTADEKCLFVMCGVQGFSNNKDNYFEGWEPIRKYLADSKAIMGWKSEDINRICGVTTVDRHAFGKSQWEFLTEENYNKLKQAAEGKAFKKEYEELKKEYEELKKEYYSTRAYFDNTHDNMNNVWHFERVLGKDREECGGHATPKPIGLCARAIKSSSRSGEKVLDVFGGSGSTLIACEQLDRKAYLMELEPKWCSVIIARWEKYTGEKAELEREGTDSGI